MNISIENISTSGNYAIEVSSNTTTVSNTFRDPCKYFYALDVSRGITTSNLNTTRTTQCIFKQEASLNREVSLCN